MHGTTPRVRHFSKPPGSRWMIARQDSRGFVGDGRFRLEARDLFDNQAPPTAKVENPNRAVRPMLAELPVFAHTFGAI